MPFSIRLDPRTEALIRRLAAASGRSRSWVVREAMAHYGAATGQAESVAATAYEALKPFLGKVRTGGRHFSEDTHTKYRAALRRKQRERRSR